MAQNQNTRRLFEHSLQTADSELFGVVNEEFVRQRDHLEMIASENYTSKAVMEAMGSVLTNKYAEGYPGKRYYGGCEYVDVVEDLARARLAKLFSVPGLTPHVNVQPHSGSQANQAVFFAMLNPGDTYMAADLAHGGHLTHGAAVNQSGKWFKAIGYTVRKQDERFDLDQVRDLAKQHRPRLLIAGYSAYSRTIDFAAFRAIADEVGALLMVDMAHISGLVAGGAHPNPFPFAHIVTSTTHKTLRGPRSGLILCHPEFAKKLDSAIFPGLQGGPLMHVIAGKAVMALEALRPEFKQYAAQVVMNAKALSDEFTRLGYRVVSGGTDNHLLCLDLREKGVTGKDAQIALDHAGINANKNTIPFDTASPMVTSGIRLGSAAITTRGMGVSEMKKVAQLIDRVLRAPSDSSVHLATKAEVQQLCRQFPIYSRDL